MAKAIVSRGAAARTMIKGKSSYINYQTTIGDANKGDLGASAESQTLDLVIELLVQAYNTPLGEEGPLSLSAVTPEMKRNIIDGLRFIFFPLDAAGNPTPFFFWTWYGPQVGMSVQLYKPRKVNPDTGQDYVNKEAMVEYSLEAYDYIASYTIPTALAREVASSGEKTSSYIIGSTRNRISKIMSNDSKFGDVGFGGTKGQRQDRSGTPRGRSMNISTDVDKDYEKLQGDDEAYFDISKYGDLGASAAQDIEAALYALGGTKPPMHQKQMYSAVISNNEKFDSLKSFAEWMVDNVSQYPAISEYFGNWPGEDSKFYVKKTMNEIASLFKSGKFLKVRQEVFDEKYAKIINKNPELGASFAGDFFGLDANADDSSKTMGGYDPVSGKEWGAVGDDGERYAQVDDPDAFYANLEEAVNFRLFELALNRALLI